MRCAFLFAPTIPFNATPSTTNHQRQTPTKARGKDRGQGQMNQGLSVSPKKGTVEACDHHRWRLAGGCRYPPATTRRAVGDGGRADLPGCVRDVSTNYLTKPACPPLPPWLRGRGETCGHGVLADHHTRDPPPQRRCDDVPNPSAMLHQQPRPSHSFQARGVVTRGGGDGRAG